MKTNVPATMLLSIVFGLVIVCLGMVLSGVHLQTRAIAAPALDVPLPVLKAEAMMSTVPPDVVVGARIFAGCAGCHDAGPAAENRVGPMLNGIVGRKAGGVEGYGYSSALARAGENGLVWTPYKLDAFLMAPNTFLSGNKMAYVGVTDKTDRHNLIGYLKTLQ